MIPTHNTSPSVLQTLYYMTGISLIVDACHFLTCQDIKDNLIAELKDIDNRAKRVVGRAFK